MYFLSALTVKNLKKDFWSITLLKKKKKMTYVPFQNEGLFTLRNVWCSLWLNNVNVDFVDFYWLGQITLQPKSVLLKSTIYSRFPSVEMRIKSPWLFTLGVSIRVLLLVHSEWQRNILINSHNHFWWTNLRLIWQPKYKKINIINDSLWGISVISCNNIII